MVRRIGALAYRLAQGCIPDPFVFCLGLTLIAFAAALLVPAEEPLDSWALHLASTWFSGFGSSGFLTFALQMSLIVVTGHALAATPPVRRAIDAIAGLPRTTAGGAALVAGVACTTALVHWGLGLIVGAFLAREVAGRARARGLAFHYPLLAAAAYTSLMVWHGGLSGSAPLKAAEPGFGLFSERDPQFARAAPLSVSQTILSGENLAFSAVLVTVIVLLCAFMAPKAGEPVSPPEEDPPAARRGGAEDKGTTVAARLERSRLLVLLVSAIAGTALLRAVARDGWAAVTINFVNALYLVTGLLLFLHPVRYARVVVEAAPGIAGIVLQFPFYGGIQAILQESGLVRAIAQGFVQSSEALAGAGIPAAASFPVLTWMAAALVNVFIPSGGGQWLIQGPIVVASAASLGVPMEKAILALSYGDEWSNMIQPFWALPILGVTGLRARDILGYTSTIMLLTGPLYVLALVFL